MFAKKQTFHIKSSSFCLLFYKLFTFMQTNTNITNRLKALITALMKMGRISSQEDLGHKLGYKNRSYISQAINGKINNMHFIKELLLFEPTINYDWIMNGNGSMFYTLKDNRKDETVGDYITYQTQKINTLESENIALKKKIEELNQQLEEYKQNDIQNLDNFFELLRMINEKVDDNSDKLEELQDLIKTQQSA